MTIAATGGTVVPDDGTGDSGTVTPPSTEGLYTLSGFSVATNSSTSQKYLKAETNCTVIAFNVEKNTDYQVIDTGSHNRFRFYGRTTADTSADMVANLVFDGIIEDQNSISNIDDWYDYSFNSGNYQTIYVYVIASDTTGITPSLTVNKVESTSSINMLYGRAYKTVDSVKKIYVSPQCICAAVNVNTNTNYKIVDSGTHNRFRFYGRTTADDLTTMHTDLLAMDGIITESIDSSSEYEFNSGTYQTIYIYLVSTSNDYTPNIAIAEV